MTLQCEINSGCCSESVVTAGEVLLQVQNAVLRLEELAEERQQKLEGCLQLRQFEERASQASEVFHRMGLRKSKSLSLRVRV